MLCSITPVGDVLPVEVAWHPAAPCGVSEASPLWPALAGLSQAWAGCPLPAPGPSHYCSDAAERGHQTKDWPMGIPLLGPRFSNRDIRGLSKRLDLSLLGLPRWEQLRRHLALQAPCLRASTCLPAWALCVRVGQSPWCARAHSTWPAPSGEEGLWATMLGDLLVR